MVFVVVVVYTTPAVGTPRGGPPQPPLGLDKPSWPLAPSLTYFASMTCPGFPPPRFSGELCSPMGPPPFPPLRLIHCNPWGLGAVPPGGHLGGAIPGSYVIVVPGEVLGAVPLDLHVAPEGQSEGIFSSQSYYILCFIAGTNERLFSLISFVS